MFSQKVDFSATALLPTARFTPNWSKLELFLSLSPSYYFISFFFSSGSDTHTLTLCATHALIAAHSQSHSHAFVATLQCRHLYKTAWARRHALHRHRSIHTLGLGIFPAPPEPRRATLQHGSNALPTIMQVDFVSIQAEIVDLSRIQWNYAIFH